ncbi:hypothetical protein MASR2M15_25790 [Anaerolineales bacterium]
MIERLISLPRWVRILIVLINALVMVLAVFALVDEIYLRYFYTPDTVVIPSLVTAVIGSIMYIWGWLYWVGGRGEQVQVSRFLYLYLGIFVIAYTLVLILIIYGLILVIQSNN